MARENEAPEVKEESPQAKKMASLDSLVAAKKARDRKHAQFLINAGVIKP